MQKATPSQHFITAPSLQVLCDEAEALTRAHTLAKQRNMPVLAELFADDHRQVLRRMLHTHPQDVTLRDGAVWMHNEHVMGHLPPQHSSTAGPAPAGSFPTEG